MTRNDLIALAERVEQGSGRDQKLEYEIFEALSAAPEHANYLTSLDAVEALRERLLPASTAFDISDYATYWTASMGFRGRRDGYSEAPTEPRARLAALLRAYSETVEG